MNDYFFSKMNDSSNIDNEFDFPNFPKELIEIFKKTAIKIGIKRIALVGGIVRDKLIYEYFQESLTTRKDIDIVIEGSVDELAKEIKESLGTSRVAILRENKSYHTIAMEVDGIFIDLSTARKESYISPAENPQIANSSLEEDLQRRDFTANAMAYDLINKQFLNLKKGSESIIKRQLEVIHRQSITEDPTRIIRGARYASRLNFQLAPTTLNQVQSTLKNWPWHWRPEDDPMKAPPSLGVRLRMELELLLNHEPWEKALQYLQDWGALLLLDKALQNDHEWKRRIHWASKLKANTLTALVAGTSNSPAIAKRLQLPLHQQKMLSESLAIQKFTNELYVANGYLNWQPSNWCKAIEEANWHSDAIAITICLRTPLWKPLFKWLKYWRFIKSPTSAKELIERGWLPGPELRKELNRLRDRQLDRFH